MDDAPDDDLPPGASDWRNPQWLRSTRRAIKPYNVGGRVTDALAGYDSTRPYAAGTGYAANVLTGAAPALVGAGPSRALAEGGLASVPILTQRATANALRTPEGMPAVMRANRRGPITHEVGATEESREVPFSVRDLFSPRGAATAAGTGLGMETISEVGQRMQRADADREADLLRKKRVSKGDIDYGR